MDILLFHRLLLPYYTFCMCYHSKYTHTLSSQYVNMWGIGGIKHFRLLKGALINTVFPILNNL